MTQTSSSQAIVLLDIDILQPNPLQPRGHFDDNSLSDLVSSIKKHGVLEPLVVAHTPAGYQIIAGERRWRAAKLAGFQQVPAIVKETTPQKMLEMAIVENVQRENLNPIERAIAFQRLVQEFGLSEKEISEQISKSLPYVVNTLRLLQLPDALKDGLIAGLISEGHARALVGIPDQQAMIQAYKQVLKESASVRRTEEIARRYKEMLLGIRSIKSTNKDQLPDIDEAGYISQNKLPAIEKKLHQFFSQKLNLKGKNAKKLKVKLKRTTNRTLVTIQLNGNPLETNKGIKQLLDFFFGSDDWLKS
ncbi:MAG: ParB/RepB/Spo0J family partition protein [bacterium]|nr:ParB/RepB/Spo0J family partition protein [bacterium]